jgi:hypothetical protein
MKNSPVLPPGNYQISGLIDFLSEWRVFVFDKKMVGLQNYSGDFTKMPNIDNVQHMMEQWKSSPRAYTLDVGIVDQNGFPGLTKVVEAHDFFSCGLYGFADYKLLPYMLLSTWKNLTIQNNISRNQNR